MGPLKLALEDEFTNIQISSNTTFQVNAHIRQIQCKSTMMPANFLKYTKKSEVQVELKIVHYLTACYSEVDNTNSVLVE